MQTLNLLCAGAAQGLVKALQERFEADAGVRVQGRFGAVGDRKSTRLNSSHERLSRMPSSA